MSSLLPDIRYSVCVPENIHSLKVHTFSYFFTFTLYIYFFTSCLFSHSFSRSVWISEVRPACKDEKWKLFNSLRDYRIVSHLEFGRRHLLSDCKPCSSIRWEPDSLEPKYSPVYWKMRFIAFKVSCLGSVSDHTNAYFTQAQLTMLKPTVCKWAKWTTPKPCTQQSKRTRLWESNMLGHRI